MRRREAHVHTTRLATSLAGVLEGEAGRRLTQLLAQKPAVVHFAYAVENLEDLVNAYLRLEHEGIVPHSCINHGFTTSLYYHDPDGNEVELQVDNYKTRESMDAWFRTGAFDRNFVGFPFDLKQMVSLYRKGIAEDEILQQELYK